VAAAVTVLASGVTDAKGFVTVIIPSPSPRRAYTVRVVTPDGLAHGALITLPAFGSVAKVRFRFDTNAGTPAALPAAAGGEKAKPTSTPTTSGTSGGGGKGTILIT
jgi:hypothetical protein